MTFFTVIQLHAARYPPLSIQIKTTYGAEREKSVRQTKHRERRRRRESQDSTTLQIKHDHETKKERRLRNGY
jgi:hypothetical protein